jgi:hypothetical protein
MSEQRTQISGHQYLGGLFIFLYRAVRNRLPVIIVVTLLVTAIAYLATPQPAPIYGAQASVRIGRVAGTEATSLQDAVARVNAQSFKRQVLRSMNLPAGDDRVARVIFDGLRARDETPDTIVVNARAFNEQQARQALELVVGRLNTEQDRVRKPAIEDIQEQIAEIDANIANLSNIQAAIWPLMKVSAASADPEVVSGDPRSVQLLDILSRNEQALIAARAARRLMVSQLSTWKTFTTAIVDDELSVSSAALSPRPSRIAFLAGGFTFAGFLLYALVSRRRIPS